MKVLLDHNPLAPSNSAPVDFGAAIRTRPAWITAQQAHAQSQFVSQSQSPSQALPAVTAYRLQFELPEAALIRVHVSADERYLFYVDGQVVGRGPERGSDRAWFYESYDLSLAAGAAHAGRAGLAAGRARAARPGWPGGRLSAGGGRCVRRAAGDKIGCLDVQACWRDSALICRRGRGRWPGLSNRSRRPTARPIPGASSAARAKAGGPSAHGGRILPFPLASTPRMCCSRRCCPPNWRSRAAWADPRIAVLPARGCRADVQPGRTWERCGRLAGLAGRRAAAGDPRAQPPPGDPGPARVCLRLSSVGAVGRARQPGGYRLGRGAAPGCGGRRPRDSVTRWRGERLSPCAAMSSSRMAVSGVPLSRCGGGQGAMWRC